MAENDARTLLSRRGFLAGASTAVVGSGLLAAGLADGAAAATEPAAPPPPVGPGLDQFKSGTVQSNGLTFRYVETGAGPLALCLHGWPDSPFTYRYLMPELARAGYRAVCPYMRGYYPTDIPTKLTDTNDLASDVVGFHQAFGGDSNAVLIAHDWGAVAAWGGAARGPSSWRRCVIMNVPPIAIVAQVMFGYPQIKREFYWWFFQQQISTQVLGLENYAFIDGIWADWSPGYDATHDLPHAKDCLRPPGHTDAALGYYRTFFDPKRFGTAEAAAEQGRVWGSPIPQRTLYMHGSQDGLFPLTMQQLSGTYAFMGPGSEVKIVEGVGHFMLAEKPQVVNANILGFLSR